MTEEPQYNAALRIANERQFKAVEIKRELAAGLKCAADVVDDPVLANRYLREILSSQRRYGNMKVERIMSQLGSFNPKCGQITSRQREKLAELAPAIPPPASKTKAPAEARSQASEREDRRNGHTGPSEGGLKPSRAAQRAVR